jgi:hypothetical protein
VLVVVVPSCPPQVPVPEAVLSESSSVVPVMVAPVEVVLVALDVLVLLGDGGVLMPPAAAGALFTVAVALGVLVVAALTAWLVE